jgi:hypothetical protein
MVFLVWLSVFLLAAAHALWFDENLYFFSLFALLFLPDVLDETLSTLQFHLQGYVDALRAQLNHLLRALQGLPGVVHGLCAQGRVYLQRRVRAFVHPLRVAALLRRTRNLALRGLFLRERQAFLTGFPHGFTAMHASSLRPTAPTFAHSAQVSPQAFSVPAVVLDALCEQTVATSGRAEFP